jgi:hypothetical protein
MFNFFRKKEAGIPVTDRVWLTTTAKLNACAEALTKNQSLIFIAWFPQTITDTGEYFKQRSQPVPEMYLAREFHRGYAAGKSLLFLEHYPLAAKEDEFFKNAGLTEALVFSSLDEPLFTFFGGDRIAAVVRNLGLPEEDPVEHSLVSKSIRNAQENIAKKISVEQSAFSAADWFALNLPR